MDGLSARRNVRVGLCQGRGREDPGLLGLLPLPRVLQGPSWLFS